MYVQSFGDELLQGREMFTSTQTSRFEGLLFGRKSVPMNTNLDKCWLLSIDGTVASLRRDPCAVPLPLDYLHTDREKKKRLPAHSSVTQEGSSTRGQFEKTGQGTPCACGLGWSMAHVPHTQDLAAAHDIGSGQLIRILCPHH